MDHNHSARLPLLILLLAGCPSDDESTESGTETAATTTTQTSTDGTTAGPTTTATSSTTASTTDATSDSTTSDATSDTGSGSSSGGEPMCPMTTLPGSVDGVEPESYSHHPPVGLAGSLYRMVETPASDGNNPKMMKSDDGGATWSEVDADGRPDARDLEGTYQLVVEDTIYFSHTAGEVWFYAFDAAADTWLAQEDVEPDLDDAGSTQYSSLARTGDGRFWIVYSSDLVGGRPQISYRRRMGADDFGPATAVGIRTENGRDRVCSPEPTTSPTCCTRTTRTTNFFTERSPTAGTCQRPSESTLAARVTSPCPTPTPSRTRAGVPR